MATKVVETHSYSPLVILTGAGASKACGLPDMRQFAKDFYASMSGRDTDYSDRDLVCQIIYGTKSIKGNPKPKRDLEALLDGLTRLGDGISGPCATTSTLLSIAGEMSDELKTALYELMRKSEELLKTSEENTAYSRNIQLDPEYAISTDPATGDIKISYPSSERLKAVRLDSSVPINLDDFKPWRSPISYEVVTVRDISKATH